MTSLKRDRVTLVSRSDTSELSLFAGLYSVERMSARDQRKLEFRLRCLSHAAKEAGAISVAAKLLHSIYDLERAG